MRMEKMPDKGHRFPFCWKKDDLDRVARHGHKVFSTFSCGGGSSFGYKMAGFDVIGCNEIDEEMVELYKANHHPTYVYHEPIQDFKGRKDLPDELFGIDVLDGSPPCSTFSMSGNRQEVWGKEKKFREGQAKQVLSDLFFDYLDVVEKLKPKVAVAENVKGLITGKAKGYCKLIRDRFRELGYEVQLFLLNSATMGVPQLRERVFFLARREDLGLPPIRLAFNEVPIPFSEVTASLPFQDLSGTDSVGAHKAFWAKTQPGCAYSSVSKGSYFNLARLSNDMPAPTILGSSSHHLSHPDQFRNLSWIEVSLCGSYPYDYDYLGKLNSMKIYCIGMSVPPVMTAQIAAKMAEQWFDVPKEQIDGAWKS
jgi:DNA (cytosine-5)-methyltransferase 1